MTEPTLGEGEAIQENEWGDSHWVKRTVAVMFCLALLVALGLVFTRVIAARVPEQRATLEKLITERTGLAVRFDNVHFSWDLDGTSAVFTRVELTDPKAGRVRAVAPELRVEFDTWDFLRHHQFSLGHVTLSSPDIEIIGDDEATPAANGAPSKTAVAAKPASSEAALMRPYLRWVELKPVGRDEVEGARGHLVSRGQPSTGKRETRNSFTLSQAVVSRGSGTFSAYGTMLLSQDVGHSLFVSAKLEGLGEASKVSGDLRVIARKIFLDRVRAAGMTGRGTIDARLVLRDGLIESGSWQASARELTVNRSDDDTGTRFDHVSVDGKLARKGNDLLVDLTDLQLTRGARLERAPALNLRLSLLPASVDIARTRVRAERVPFMAAQLIAGALQQRIDAALPPAPEGWMPTAAVLRDVYFDSGEGQRNTRSWSFSARVSELELTRAADQAKLSQLAADLRFGPREYSLRFHGAQAASLRAPQATEARPLTLAGEVALLPGDAPAWRFDGFSASSGPARLAASGEWNRAATRSAPLKLEITELDRALLQDAWALVAPDREQPELLAGVQQGRLVDASFELLPDESGAVHWTRSNGALHFADLSMSGEDLPRVSEGRGAVNFARGTTRLHLEAGKVEDLAIRSARMDWPRRGAPRLQAALDGRLESALLREVLEAQGLEDFAGAVMLEADARGEKELRDPRAWRVVAHVSDATMPLGGGLPRVEKLAGTIRYSAGQLRGLALEGHWLGGPVQIESRRSGNRGGLGFAMNGIADAAPLLDVLGQGDAAQRVNGQFSWNGTAQPDAHDGWQLTLSSNLAGLESRLPEPFGKTRARNMPIKAELGISREGVRDFLVDARDVEIRGQVLAGVTTARFDVQGVSGELRHSKHNESELRLDQLQFERSPQVLAVAAALLPTEGEVTVIVDEARYATRSLGPLRASISREGRGVEFSLDSSGNAVHRVSLRGECLAGERCRADFSAASSHLAALLRDQSLPAEWPTQSLQASGSLDWPVDVEGDFARSLGGSFVFEASGAGSDHQLSARASIADGEILLTDVQGVGPEADQVFRGQGRVGLLARDYDVTVDYERVSLAAAAVPSQARARLARAWNAVRGSAARRGWTEAPETRRVQWHGTWD